MKQQQKKKLKSKQDRTKQNKGLRLQDAVNCLLIEEETSITIGTKH